MKFRIKLIAVIILIFLSGCSAGIDNTAYNPVVEQVWIELETAPYDLTDMRLAWCSEVDLNEDGSTQLISLYVNAMRRGEYFVYDDGQEWVLLVESDKGAYPLFERGYVQIGNISCSFYRSMDDDRALHILVENSQGAGMEIYDCVYDPEKDAFMRVPVYLATNISSFGGSEELRGWFYNPKVDNYKQILAGLPIEDKSEAKEAFDALMPMMSRGEILPDEAVDAFIDFHVELVQNIELDVDFEALGYEITQELRDEYARYFIRLYQSEGYLCATTEFAGIGDALFEHADFDYKAYFNLMRWQRDEGLEQLASDAGLIVSWNQLADLIEKYQNFTRALPDISQTRGLDEQLKYYKAWYLETGLDNSPIKDRNGVLLHEVKASYEYFMETYPDSTLFQEVLNAYNAD